MKFDVKKFVLACLFCQQVKHTAKPPIGLLNPLPILKRVLEDVHIDFITSLPKSQGFLVILVMVNRLTKYCHLRCLQSHFTVTQVALVFLQLVVKFHGFPMTIVLYRDPIITSNFWKELFHLSGTTFNYSSTYHP